MVKLCETTGSRPANVPSCPHWFYKHDGWQDWGHWLGTGNIAGSNGHRREFLPFKEALLHARFLKLKSQKQWEAWRTSGARPANIPAGPDKTYKHAGWQGWGHWLGTGTVSPKTYEFLPFKKALLYARSLKLKSVREWNAWAKSGARPGNIPSSPQKVYMHDGWQGYSHWLGTCTATRGIPKAFLPFALARLYARSLKLQSYTAWQVWYKSGARPSNIPTNPHKTYKHEGWQGHADWLGYESLCEKCESKFNLV